jgi:hypothetical protein
MVFPPIPAAYETVRQGAVRVLPPSLDVRLRLFHLLPFVSYALAVSCRAGEA